MSNDDDGPGPNASFGHRHGLTVMLVLMGLALIGVIMAQML